MVIPPGVADTAEYQGIIAWLEDQRRQDRAEIARIALEVERLFSLVREQVGAGAELRAGLEAVRNTLVRFPLLEDGVRQARDQVAASVERLDSQGQQHAQAILSRAAEADRDRRRVAEVIGAIDEIQNAIQAQNGRIQVVGDEVRRDRAAFIEVPATVHALDQRLGQMGHRLEQQNEAIRRTEAHIISVQERLEALIAEVEKGNHWRQLAEVRWTRQAGEWQQNLVNFKESMDDQIRPARVALEQVGQVRDEIRGLTSALFEHSHRLDELVAAHSRLDGITSQQRDLLGRVSQVVDAQRRRFDEQASAQLRLDESIGRGVDERQALDRRADEQARAIDALQQEMRNRVASIDILRNDLETREVTLRSDAQALREAFDRQIESVRLAVAETGVQIAEARRLLNAFLMRLASDAEEHARELDEVPGRSGRA